MNAGTSCFWSSIAFIGERASVIGILGADLVYVAPCASRRGAEE
jgi:hypothetical protein